MTDLLSMVQVVLGDAGYRTWLSALDRGTTICFEDEAILGFGCIFSDPNDLLRRWQSIERSLLTRNVARLQDAGDKAWNVYLLLLSQSSGSESEAREVSWIEENLERTRKLTACGPASRDAVVRSLLPLLPFQYQPVLDAAEAKDRLRRRIEIVAPLAARSVFDDSVDPADVVRLLGTRI